MLQTFYDIYSPRLWEHSKEVHPFKTKQIDTFLKRTTHKCLPALSLHIQNTLMQPIYLDYLIFSAGRAILSNLTVTSMPSSTAIVQNFALQEEDITLMIQ